MKIEPEFIPLAYDIAKAVVREQIRPSEGVKKLTQNGKMRSSSARDYIYILRYMLKGQRFTRTLNQKSMEYFLSKIGDDFGHMALRRTLLAIEQHIDYYQNVSKSKMVQLGGLVKTYKISISSPVLITHNDHIIQNIDTLEHFLTSEIDLEKYQALQIIKKGQVFLAYTREGEERFVPSRYLGYQNNEPYLFLNGIHGGDTNKTISKILEQKERTDEKLEKAYVKYCHHLGIAVNHENDIPIKKRKFWTIHLPEQQAGNREIFDGFPEGKIVERMHRTRERNSRVIILAKALFKKKHGSLHCEVCKINFEETYGEKIGKDYIEGHHTRWISGMKQDEKTEISDIAMLCANCHRMAHRRRPWLSMDQLTDLLKK